MAPALRAACRRDRRLPARADRGRRAGDPDLRLVGRRAQRAPTTASSRCPTRRDLRRLAGAGVPLIHFGVGTTAILRDLCRGRRRRHRPRLAPAARRGLGRVGRRSRRAGQPRSDAAARPARSPARGADDVLRRAAAGPGTSSISATASCRHAARTRAGARAVVHAVSATSSLARQSA